MNEPKDSREVKCTTYINQTLHVRPSKVVETNAVAYVSIEGGRVSLDLSPAEALALVEAVVWATNGGNTG